MWCGALRIETNVHYCLASIKSGKCPNRCVCFLLFRPSVRFHWMKIICPWCWCLIQHLFQRDDAYKTMRERKKTTPKPLPFLMVLAATLNENTCRSQISSQTMNVSISQLFQLTHRCDRCSMFKKCFNGYFWMCAQHQRQKQRKKMGKYDPV